MTSDENLESATPSLSLVVLTRNEELNIAPCLDGLLGWVRDILVVDSGSTDRTVEIAQSYGATVVSHEFETHAKQWDWALANLPIRTEWVLGLDADQRVTAELRDEISAFVNEPGNASPRIAGAYIKRRQIFRGQWIRHGGYYPKYLLKFFRASSVSVDPGDLVDHHFRVNGQVVKLKHDIIEDNRNEADISVWTAKHNRYAKLQAQQEYLAAMSPRSNARQGRLFGAPDERTTWLKSLWGKLPLYVRPFLYFFYRYFIRLGFLDGKQGFIFHFMQAFWYRLLVDINLDELRSAGESLILEGSTSGLEDSSPVTEIR